MRSTQDTASKYSQGIQTNLVAEWQEEPLRSEDFSRTGTLVHVLEAIELVRSADYHLCMCRTNGTECDGITEVKNRKKHLKEKHPDILSEYPGKDDKDPYCRSPTMSDVIRKATSFGCAFFQRHPEPQPQLTLNDVHSIYVYTLETEIYGSMNRCLREGDTVELAKWGPVIYHVQQALAKIPELSSGWSQLYRGIDLKVEGYLEGSIFPWPSFSSSSLKLDVVLSFAGTECGSIFMIRPLAKNSRGRPIADLSEFPSEMEVLFPPNSVFSVQQQLGIGAKDLLSRVLKLKDPGLTHVDVYELHELPLDWAAVQALHRLLRLVRMMKRPMLVATLVSVVCFITATVLMNLTNACDYLDKDALLRDTPPLFVFREPCHSIRIRANFLCDNFPCDVSISCLADVEQYNGTFLASTLHQDFNDNSATLAATPHGSCRVSDFDTFSYSNTSDPHLQATVRCPYLVQNVVPKGHDCSLTVSDCNAATAPNIQECSYTLMCNRVAVYNTSVNCLSKDDCVSLGECFPFFSTNNDKVWLLCHRDHYDFLRNRKQLYPDTSDPWCWITAETLLFRNLAICFGMAAGLLLLLQVCVRLGLWKQFYSEQYLTVLNVLLNFQGEYSSWAPIARAL